MTLHMTRVFLERLEKEKKIRVEPATTPGYRFSTVELLEKVDRPASSDFVIHDEPCEKEIWYEKKGAVQ